MEEEGAAVLAAGVRTRSHQLAGPEGERTIAAVAPGTRVEGRRPDGGEAHTRRVGGGERERGRGTLGAQGSWRTPSAISTWTPPTRRCSPGW